MTTASKSDCHYVGQNVHPIKEHCLRLLSTTVCDVLGRRENKLRELGRVLGTTGIDYTSPEERLAAMPQFKLRSQYEAKKIDLADESAMVAIRVQRSMQ